MPFRIRKTKQIAPGVRLGVEPTDLGGELV